MKILIQLDYKKLNIGGTTMAVKISSKSKEVKEKSPAQQEKELALKPELDKIEKNFGKGPIMRLGENAGVRSIPVIPTGPIPFDKPLGVAG